MNNCAMNKLQCCAFRSHVASRLHIFQLLFPMLLCLLCNLSVRAENKFNIDDGLYAMYERAHRLRSSEACLAIGDSMLAEAKRIGDEKAECIALTIPLRYYYHQESAETFAEYCDMVRERAKETGYMQYYHYAYEMQTTYFINRNQMREAEELLGIMRDEVIAAQDYYGLALCYSALGNLYYQRRGFRVALKYYDQALELYEAQTLQHPSGVLAQAAIASIKDRDYNRALAYVEKGLAITPIEPSVKLNLLERKGMALFFLERNAEFKKNLAEYYTSREKEGRNNSHNIEYIPILNTIVDGRYAEAERIMKEYKSRMNALLYHLTLKELYTRSGDHASATAELDSMYELRVRYFNKILDEDFQSKAAKLDNERLKFENSMLELEEKRRHQQYITAIISITALFAIVALAIFLALRIRSSRRLQAQNLQLEEARAHAEEAKTHAVRAQLRAEHSELMKTIFIQNMSHEIRTPLNAIVGFAQLLAEPDIADTFSDDEKREYSQLIGGNADMLMTLVNDILNISDLESGKYKMNLAPCECNDVCRFCLKNVEVRQPAGVRMYFTTEADDSFSLYTDRQRVQQVLTNFLTNACKHTSKGEIHLHLSLSENPGNVTFSVTDTGTGVPADQAEAIFERFTKLDSFKQGTGLGLAICRMIAEILHGEVKLDTTYTAGGARFVFIHPLTQEQA